MDDYNFDKIGLELKRLRVEHAYTQEQIADSLGCTVSFISNIENNRAKLNLRILIYYAQLCNVSVDSILNKGKDDAGNGQGSCVRDAEFLDLLHQFSPEAQEQIIVLLKNLKNLTNKM